MNKQSKQAFLRDGQDMASTNTHTHTHTNKHSLKSLVLVKSILHDSVRLWCAAATAILYILLGWVKGRGSFVLLVLATLSSSVLWEQRHMG